MPLKMSDTLSDKMAFLLFGDQSLDTHEFLTNICHRSNLGVLSRSFLEEVGFALREQVDQLSSLERQRVPMFSSIQELNKRYHIGGYKNSAVDSALLCITQLADYIESVRGSDINEGNLLTLRHLQPCRKEVPRFDNAKGNLPHRFVYWSLCSYCNRFFTIPFCPCADWRTGRADGISNWGLCCCTCRSPRERL